MPRITPSLLATLVLVAAAGAACAAKPHEHGVVKLDVAIEGDKLTVALEAPLDNLLGFERAPRTDAERKAATDVLARLRAPAGLFVADAAAQCTMAKADVQAPVLEAGAKAKDGHADLDATYEFKCAQPAQLRALDVGLFEAYKRIQRIEVQVAGPQGQAKTTLRRPARSVKLAK
ncbi:MAG: DUF2796 domain-containing protein [Rubrivivax sp.]|nr:DUF2796 domain-containing protein [Rubrivivax sp.]